ncbi:molybdate-anion transporter-like isoform X1 [Limulus polyphemus]|uniref:Molybdate-anion transporter n=2 Tax=Limulus polyphemus TaxID=6850 RepID=A0ABM1BCI8_LIMPO|nr:molybdate-anion transporter-like isoform X1 [Limulus polyphemus]XP_022247017.1 molybdate-anion transporter-like isoform X1 [Limulus polyphemus]XP_022247019.1 molybdate-anion transporter-like isoform X1 [Limulus polyphemus]XP_022247020.1 molybdate-anion transporter-like isoform X1 [Limulus polyphemus]
MIDMSSNLTFQDSHTVKMTEGERWLASMTYSLFVALAIVCLFLQYLAQRTKSQVSSGNNKHFLQFQKKYFIVYFLALFGDWLQGPYVYKLYSHYGFVESQIAMLYVVGFGASVLFGTGTGALADRFGRKKMCICFSIMYSLCCLTKLSPNYYVLMLGRFLGGISTSLLFSTFESWYVYEHTQTYDFPTEWISVTFSKATFWNGILAINAGVVADLTSEWFAFGPVSPFIVAIPFLLLSGALVAQMWNENFGDQTTHSFKACMEGLSLILLNEKILLLGIVQSVFESAMYIFVFLWTPILDPGKPPLGMVFSVFMICIMIGSSVYQLLSAKHVSSQKILTLAVFLSFFSMCLCVISTNPQDPKLMLSFIAFLVIEISVGLYFPSMSYLKSQVIPESHRANIMNWFRVPLNIITCLVLLWLHTEDSKAGNRIIFVDCSLMMFIGALVMWRLDSLLAHEDVTKGGKSSFHEEV